MVSDTPSTDDPIGWHITSELILVRNCMVLYHDTITSRSELIQSTVKANLFIRHPSVIYSGGFRGGGGGGQWGQLPPLLL